MAEKLKKELGLRGSIYSDSGIEDDALLDIWEKAFYIDLAEIMNEYHIKEVNIRKNES